MLQDPHFARTVLEALITIVYGPIVAKYGTTSQTWDLVGFLSWTNFAHQNCFPAMTATADIASGKTDLPMSSYD